MSLNEKSFFLYDPSQCSSPIRLGDDRTELINQGLLLAIPGDTKEETEYQGTNKTPWRVEFTNGKVSKMAFTRQSNYTYLGEECLGRYFPEILPALSRPIPSEIKEGGSHKTDQRTPDRICVIRMDQFVTMVIVLKGQD